MEKTGTGRRTMLQRTLALLAGGVAVGTGARWTRAGAQPVEPGGGPLTVYARTRPFTGPPNGAPAGQAPGTQLSSGELLDAPDGKVIGAFHTNCFCLGGIGTHHVAGPSLELQVLQLKDGTLFGICSGPGADGAKSHAIVGGTERYAAARGAYVERVTAARSAGFDVVQFVVTLAV
jgi:hypothetical protein